MNLYKIVVDMEFLIYGLNFCKRKFVDVCLNEFMKKFDRKVELVLLSSDENNLIVLLDGHGYKNINIFGKSNFQIFELLLRELNY